MSDAGLRDLSLTVGRFCAWLGLRAGSYATAALSIGAAAGPLIGAVALAADVGDLGPVWASSVLVAVALLIALPRLQGVTPKTDTEMPAASDSRRALQSQDA